MTTNTLDQIKQTENQAKKIIADARQKVENLVSRAQKDGEEALAKAQNQVSFQIEEIVEIAKKEIQNLKVKQEKELAKQLQQLNNIDPKIIDQAARLMVKEIIK